MPPLTTAQIAERIGARIVGRGDLSLTGVAPLETAGPHDLSFYASSKYSGRLRASRAGAVIVATDDAAPERVQLVCKDPYLGLRGALLAFHRLVPVFAQGVARGAIVAEDAAVDRTAGVGPGAVVEAGARVEAGAYVGAGCYIGAQCSIGPESYLYPNVTLYHNVRVGRRVMIHSGAVLGADGFGFARSSEGALKIPQVGGVCIGDDVEIGANSTIDRATLGDTRVGRGTKIDNLVMIGHNVEIGEHCLIVSQVGIAGSTRVGNGVTIGGQAGLVGHIEIGDGVSIGAQSGVSNDLEAHKTYLGSPARELGDQKRLFAYLGRLPEWAKRLRALEEAVAGTRG